MNDFQKKFYEYILDRVQTSQLEQAKALLNEGFSKQADQTYDQAYNEYYKETLIKILKPEYVEEVSNILNQHKF